jgi:hypothetical protein
MLNFVIIVLTLLACLLLIGVILSLSMCIKGGTAIVLPGLGLIVATPLILQHFLLLRLSL